MILHALEKVASEKGFSVDNYGMYSAEDECQLTYVQVGILAAVLLNAGAADYVITDAELVKELCLHVILFQV